MIISFALFCHIGFTCCFILLKMRNYLAKMSNGQFTLLWEYCKCYHSTMTYWASRKMRAIEKEIFTCWFVCEIDILGRRELGGKYQVMSLARSLYFSPCRINQVCNFDFIRLRMSGVISSLSELFQLNASKCLRLVNGQRSKWPPPSPPWFSLCFFSLISFMFCHFVSVFNF